MKVEQVAGFVFQNVQSGLVGVFFFLYSISHVVGCTDLVEYVFEFFCCFSGKFLFEGLFYSLYSMDGRLSAVMAPGLKWIPAEFVRIVFGTKDTN